MSHPPAGRGSSQASVPPPPKALRVTVDLNATTHPFAEYGVLMFAYSAASNAPIAVPVGHLDEFAIQHVRTGQPIAGVPIRFSAVETLFVARSRGASLIRAQAAKFPSPANAAEYKLRHIGEREFDWARSEGLYCATTGVAPNTARAVMQRIPHPIPPHMFEGISRLNMQAKAKGHYVLMFAQFDDGADALLFRDMVSELFDIAVCEADPGHQAAFSIRNSTAESGLLASGQDVMVQVKEENARYSFSTEALIAPTVIDRVIWKMRCDDASLTMIGNVVELNKSNVKRRLDKMRKPHPSELSDDWRKTYDGLFNIPPRSEGSRAD